MAISFIHLSDIHFGQEKDGSELIIHDDVKEELIRDAALQVRELCPEGATGIIVTGDIAYAGKTNEYDQAGKWLDRLSEAIGCPRTAVQVVPGNHDIDRDAISSGCRLMLEQIVEVGKLKLDEFLCSELDREVLYGRFSGYRPFAEGYDCPLDRNGGHASDRSFELAPSRNLRFIGLNSALISSPADKKGFMLLGARQHVLPRIDGEELVVLAHHPLDWLRDSDETMQYVKSRARVFISGHEHNPTVNLINIKDGVDLLMLAAGATVPPVASEGFNYSYNLLIFDWDEESDGLKLKIIPRAWSKEDTCFDSDRIGLGESTSNLILGCPNFRRKAASGNLNLPVAIPLKDEIPDEEFEGLEPAQNIAVQETQELTQFRIILLRFFRDLTSAQRLAVLFQMDALPAEWSQQLTHAIERRIVNAIVKQGRLRALESEIEKIQALNSNN